LKPAGGSFKNMSSALSATLSRLKMGMARPTPADAEVSARARGRPQQNRSVAGERRGLRVAIAHRVALSARRGNVEGCSRMSPCLPPLTKEHKGKIHIIVDEIFVDRWYGGSDAKLEKSP
jgi:hypothetical protein